MEHFQSYFFAYGYLAVFLFIYCGIVGIPSPEESFMIFVGITLSQAQEPLSLPLCIFFAAFGSVTGMITSYLIGYYVGKPFIAKYGKYIGLTPKRWVWAKRRFEKHAFWTLVAGFFIPGIRQINPYMAGLSHYRLLSYTVASIIGSSLWSAFSMLLGYFLGNKAREFFTFNLTHVVILGSIFFLIFILITAYQFRRDKQKSR